MPVGRGWQQAAPACPPAPPKSVLASAGECDLCLVRSGRPALLAPRQRPYADRDGTPRQETGMGAQLLDKDVRGLPWVQRLAVAAGAFALLGVGTTLTAPAAWAGAVPGPATLRPIAGGPPPPGGLANGPLAQAHPPLPRGPPSPGAPPAPASAPAFNARPPTPPAPPLPPPAPAAGPEPSVRVVLAPDARGPLPPAV